MMNAEMKRSGRRHEGTKARRHEVPECGRIAPPAFLPTLRASPGAPGCLRASRRKGFTFLEVLFSVIIIGIGFIMIAAMFPVAIQQAQQNVAESASVAMSRDAMRYLQASASRATMSPNSTIHLKSFPLGGLTAGNQVQTADRRFGWVALYRWDGDANGNPLTPYAQVWVVTAQSTLEGQPTYGSAPAVGSVTAITATITYAPGASTLSINPYSNLPPSTSPQLAVRDGAFALVTGMSGSATTAQQNALVGWYGRLGVNAQGVVAYPGSAWYLQSDPPPAGFAGVNSTQQVSLYVLGKPLLTLSAPGVFPLVQERIGLAQDVTCTTGFVRVNN